MYRTRRSCREWIGIFSQVQWWVWTQAWIVTLLYALSWELNIIPSRLFLQSWTLNFRVSSALHFCFGYLGIYAASRNQAEVRTAFYMSVAKTHIPESQLLSAIKHYPMGFGVNLGLLWMIFTRALENYQQQARNVPQACTRHTSLTFLRAQRW